VALVSAIHLHRNRRNLTDAEIIRYIKALDRRKRRGGDHKCLMFQRKSKASNKAIEKSAKETAKVVGVSRAKVERARTVLEHADHPLHRGAGQKKKTTKK
jgi:hypothetical protein